MSNIKENIKFSIAVSLIVIVILFEDTIKLIKNGTLKTECYSCGINLKNGSTYCNDCGEREKYING